MHHNTYYASFIGCLLGGRKIEAIKQLRLELNIGLKEAKDVVESIELNFVPRPEMRTPEQESCDRFMVVCTFDDKGDQIYHFTSRASAVSFAKDAHGDNVYVSRIVGEMRSVRTFVELD